MSLGPNTRPPRDVPTGVADARPHAATTGLRLLAGVLLLLSGTVQVLQGIAAVNSDGLLASTSSTYDGNLTTWGWFHIVIGGIVALVGIGVVRNSTLGRALAIPLVIISMLGNFAFLPHYPLWAIVIIFFDIVILWAIVTAPEY